MPPLVAVDIGNSRIKLGRFGPVTGPRSGGAATRSLPEPVDTLDLPLTNRTGEFDSAPLARWCSAADVGKSKVKSLAARLRAINPNAEVVEFDRYLDKDNTPRWTPAALEDVTADMVAHFFAPVWPAYAHPLRHLE